MALCAEVQTQCATALGDAGNVRVFHLAQYDIGHCLGEFDCWVKSPGRCRIHDEGQEIERAVHDAQLLVFITPIVFGGYSSLLKKAVDRLIPLVSPFFVKRHDLTHHQSRYSAAPRLVGIGFVQDRVADVEPGVAQLFSDLVQSNALNLNLPAWGAAAVSGDAPTSWAPAIAKALNSVAVPGNPSGSFEGAQRHLQRVILPQAFSPTQRIDHLPRVVLLAASGRAPGRSNSEAILRYLGNSLKAGGAEVNHVNASAFLRDGATARAHAQQCAEADILVIGSPLYVDSVSYPAVLAMEQIQAARAGLGRPGGKKQPPRFVVVLNCGFPEPEQLRFALDGARAFAHESGLHFAGGLAVGGGELIHGRDLEAMGGIAHRLRQALDASAASLLAGDCLPASACQQVATTFMPPALYRLMGGWGWRFRNLAQGFPLRDLRARPFDGMEDAQWQSLAAAGPLPAHPLRVVGKVPEATDAVTLLLEDPARHALQFEAGQYITLELPIGGDRVRRAYSLSGAPCDGQLSITVKRVPGGLASNWIHDHLAIDALVRSHGPAGQFTLAPRQTGAPRHVLLMAGGSGIAPLHAMARQVLATEPEARVCMIYGSRSLERCIFAARLSQLAEQHPQRFWLRYVFEVPPPDWTGATGQMDPATLGPLLQGIALDTVQQTMVCGPDGMRSAVRQTLAQHGVAREQVHEESFISPRRTEVPDVEQQATFVDAGRSRTFAVAVGHTLLESALDAGVPINFSCCSGGCGACRVRVTDGLANVVLDEPNTVRADQRAQGLLPACLVRLKGPCRFAIE